MRRRWRGLQADAQLGICRGACSRSLAVRDDLVFEWLAHLLQSGNLSSFMVEPPCATFSPAAYPALRSLGFDPTEPRTLLGNRLALRDRRRRPLRAASPIQDGLASPVAPAPGFAQGLRDLDRLLCFWLAAPEGIPFPFSQRGLP